MNKNINITLYMTHASNSQMVDKNAVFKSRDIGVVDIILSVYRHKLKDTDKVQVLTVFENSGSRLITEAIVANGVATYEFDTSLIIGNDKVSNYVYLDFDGKKADLGGFTFKTELSEIDGYSEQIRIYYDKKYEDLIEGFRENTEEFEESIGDMQNKIMNYFNNLPTKDELKGEKGDKGEQGEKGETPPLATDLLDGIISKEDKSKLDSIERYAEVNRAIATQSEAEDGVENDTDMTPLRTKQAIAKQSMVVVNHGDISDTPRPPGAVAVYWIGAAEPSNSSDNDLWIGSQL